MWCVERWHCRWPRMTFEGHFSCRNHLSTNMSLTYYAPDLRRQRALSVDGRRLSVCRPVPRFKSRTERLRKPMIRVTRKSVSKSKSQGHRADYSWHTKCAVSSEREELRTSNLVDEQSLDLRKSPYWSFYLEQHSATNQNTQQHEASRGLSAIAELLIESLLMTRANKNLAIANSSRVSCAHNSLTASSWPWNLS